MNATKPFRQRTRQLMLAACELGAKNFDSQEHLIRTHIPLYPDRSGLNVAQSSLEYAIALLETGGDTARANRIVNRVLDFQVRDPGALRYGNFIWHAHWTTVKDPNAIDFVLPNLVYLWNRHRSKLTPRTRRRLQAAWPLCVHAMQRHRVDWSYTNIFLLGVLGRFLLAPLLPRTDLDEDARSLWRTFLKGTAHFGIAEYNSPTYLPVCIYALEQLQAFGPRDLRGQFEAMLQYFYFELAVRYHAPSRFLSGVMSRAYPWDKEPGGSFVSLVAHRQWGEPCRPRSPFFVNWLLTNYVVPRAIRRIALKKQFPLLIRSRSLPKQIERTDYLDRDFTMASQNGGWYGDQQVPLFITIRGEQGGEALHVEPSIPFAARLASQQHGAEVNGTFTFDPVEVRYHVHLRDSKSPAGFHDGLAFRWHLGSRELVRGVHMNGRRWNGNPITRRGKASLVLDLGSVRLSLRLAASALKLHWNDNRLFLDAILRTNVGVVTPSSELPSMSFRLRIGKGKRAPAITSLAPNIIHSSRLARIAPDDLLDFFQGRSPAPWSR